MLPPRKSARTRVEEETHVLGTSGDIDHLGSEGPSPVIVEDQGARISGDTAAGSQRRASEPTAPLRQGFDEYGGELAHDARIWPTYVKEAENWDEDMVDGWNRSLDVILVFAALFSAISTAFLIESTKNLKQDPSEISAATLQEVTLLLRVIAHGQPANSTSDNAPTADQYAPTLAAVYVNALWFLSLSLSVSVSLVAMLAKQWCYSYMSGRTGQPHVQARQRQRRLDGLERWKMPEILAFLPTLMHLSLILFFVGLTIYLWNIHIGVAIPVLAITAMTFVFYAVTTILPIGNAYCPYNTPLSQYLDAALRKLLAPFRHSGFTRRFLVQQYDSDSAADLTQSLSDEVTSRALSWLITHSQDARSVDLALQAIAGADPRMPVKPLVQSNIVPRLAGRFMGCFSVHPKTGLTCLSDVGLAEVASLYGRALTFVLSYAPNQAAVASELKIATGTAEEKRPLPIDAGYKFLKDMEQTRQNVDITAFGAANMSMWREFWARVGWPWPDSPLTGASNVLRQHVEGRIALHPSTLVALVQTLAVEAARWLGPRYPRSRGSVAMVLVNLLGQSSQHSSDPVRPAIAVALASFELALQDYPGGISKPSAESRTRRAQNVVRMYESRPCEDDHDELLVFGLLGLLINCRAYQFGSAEIVAIAARLRTTLKTDMNSTTLPFLPPSFDLNEHLIHAIQFHLAPLSVTEKYLVGEEARAELLNILTVTSHLWAHNERVYSILAKTLQHAQTEVLQQSCLTAIGSQWTHTPPTRLLRTLFDQGAFRRLLALLDSRHPTISPMAMIALWTMVVKTLEARDATGDSISEQADKPSFDAWLALKSVNDDGLFSTLAGQFHPMDEAIIPVVGPNHVEMWFQPLEALSREFPREVLESNVLTKMARFYELNMRWGTLGPMLLAGKEETTTSERFRVLNERCAIAIRRLL